ncbi:MAG: FecR domain-containing protein [Sphingobacterium sp.]|jgi:hypothetical protein|nr:FecR domain-containing protein [Sphingobacterium sp.]
MTLPLLNATIMIHAQRIDYLIHAFEQGVLTVEEEEELNSWFNSFTASDLEYPDEELMVQSRMFVRLMDESGYVSKVRRLQKIRFWSRVAVAIAVFFIAGVAYYYTNSLSLIVPKNSIVVAGKMDIKPGGNSAKLILEDGSVMDLEEGNGEIKMGEDILYSDGRSLKGSKEQLYKLSVTNPILKLKTPKAGQYRIQLSDGTVVWMNAETMLTYPKEFTDKNTRQIELEGEAYFEVAHNAAKPFVIKTDKQFIQVLGTTFNVENYPNRNVVRTTLLTGAVKIHTEHGDNMLKPGQQIIVSSEGTDIRNVHADDAVAWKNGRFLFYNERLYEVMYKISSWYDVPIAFKQVTLKSEKIFAAVSRYENISVVLAKIEATGVASFIIEKNKIQVIPHNKK